MSLNLSFPVNAFLLVGPTGAGKSPLGNFLVDAGFFGRRCMHLDFGAELRAIAELKNDSLSIYTQTEIEFIRAVLNRGLLLENEHFPLAQKIISQFLIRSSHSKEDILILNGIPRHTGQARAIEQLVTIHAVITLLCSTDTVYCRLENNVGGDRTERTDDNKKLVSEKLRTFNERTAPLISYYEKKGARIYKISISEKTTPQTAHTMLLSLASINPPITLVAKPPK